jgi:hypothetical protein
LEILLLPAISFSAFDMKQDLNFLAGADDDRNRIIVCCASRIAVVVRDAMQHVPQQLCGQQSLSGNGIRGACSGRCGGILRRDPPG